jgi:hypothetical protein
MLQNEQIIDWWDDYHKENLEKEWILKQSKELLEFLESHCPNINEGRDVLKLMEVGCGTSALARDLWRHMISNPNTKTPVHM